MSRTGSNMTNTRQQEAVAVRQDSVAQHGGDRVFFRDGREEQLKASQRKGDYTVLAMPPLKPWEFALLTKAE
jgi:hypothetical protein